MFANLDKFSKRRSWRKHNDINRY